MAQKSRAAWIVTFVALLGLSPAAALGSKTVDAVWTELPPAETASGAAETMGLPNLSALVKRAAPAVVSIIVEEPSPVRLPPSDPLHEFFDRFYGEQPNEGLGTGFIIDPSGLILTNAHVVENAARIRVILEDEGYPQEYLAKVVGRDAATDLAILRISTGRKLPVLPLGDSDQIEIADWVVAIGNPFGLAQSVTFGIVSQTGRTDITPQGREGYFDFIQTDASINPGNSGGPLLNLRGEVVAINNAVNASGQGIGFSVPINMAKRILPQLVADGKVTRGWLGLSIRDLTLDFAHSLGLKTPRGVVISELTPGGPAAKGGLEVGDVILSFAGRPVRGAHKLRWEVACAPIGEQVPVEVMRKGKKVQLKVEPTRQPTTTASLERRLPSWEKLGFSAMNPNASDTLVSGTPVGASVVELAPQGRAALAGLKQGDLIVGLGEMPVTDARELAGLLRGVPAGTLLELHVRRGPENVYVALRMPA